jgi:hypothetical protein
MISTTKETDMNEFSQIRERFLADARQYLLAGDANKSQCFTYCADDCSCRNTHDSLSGQNSQ